MANSPRQPGKKMNPDTEFPSSDPRQSTLVCDSLGVTNYFPWADRMSKESPFSEHPKDLTISSRPMGNPTYPVFQSTSIQSRSDGHQAFAPRPSPSITQTIGLKQHWQPAEALRPIPFPIELFPLSPELTTSSARSAFAALSTLAYSSLLRGQPLGLPFSPSSMQVSPGSALDALSTTIPAGESRTGTENHHLPAIPCPNDQQSNFSLGKGMNRIGELLPENLEYWYRQQQQQHQQQQLNNLPLSTGPGGVPWLALNNGDLNSSAGRRKNATRETTSILKAWLNEHRKNPYPTKSEKIMLAIITKMSLTQVSTWFANARRRLKKENKMTWTTRGTTAAPGSPMDPGENGETDDEVEEGLDSVADIEEEMKTAGLTGMGSLMDATTLRRIFNQFNTVGQLISSRSAVDACRQPEEELLKPTGLALQRQGLDEKVYKNASFERTSHYDNLGESVRKHPDMSKPFFTDSRLLGSPEFSKKEVKEAPSKRKIWSLADIVQERSTEDNTNTTCDNSIDKSTNSPSESPQTDKNRCNSCDYTSGQTSSSPKRLRLGLTENDFSPNVLPLGNDSFLREQTELVSLVKNTNTTTTTNTTTNNNNIKNTFLPPASLTALLMHLHHQSRHERLPEVAQQMHQAYHRSPHCQRPQPHAEGCLGSSPWPVNLSQESLVVSSQSQTAPIVGLPRSQW